MFRTNISSAPQVWGDAAPRLCTTTRSRKRTPNMGRKREDNSTSHVVEYFLNTFYGNSVSDSTRSTTLASVSNDLEIYSESGAVSV